MAEVALAPVPAQERVLVLDVLRGIALFGVLAVNMQVFAGQSSAAGIGSITQILINILIQSKFITLFAFLFGVGFALQMSRAEARGIHLSSFYPKRLLALALFGMIHSLAIWPGDVLLSYSVLGALLLVFRNLSQKAVLYWSVGIATSLILFLTGRYVAMPHGPDEAAASGPTWLTSTYYNLLISIPLLSVFLLGLWVWRTGVLDHPDQHVPLLKRVCVVTLALGLVLNTADTLVPLLAPFTIFTDWFVNVLGLLFPPILSAGYASALILLLRNQKWTVRLKPFAAVGRMALTNYLTQSVVCTIFFSTSGLAGKLGPGAELALTIMLYGGQVLASNWWLGRYRYGPMEWVWRGMTYGNFPALVRTAELDSRSV